MKRILFLLVSILLLATWSCRENKHEFTVVTQLIQYDVVLKNPDTTAFMPLRYMQDTIRMHFLENILRPVLAGEVTAYTWKNNKLLPEDLAELKIRFGAEAASQDSGGTKISNARYNLEMVSKIRYFEQWEMDKKTLEIQKKVLGFSLIHDSYDQFGEYRGTEPLFYVFYDKEFAAKYEKISLAN
jgi:hypothetical protein